MEFVYTPELLEYMEQKKQKNIVVEVVACDHSDIEITELYVHLLNERLTKFFKEEKHFRSVKTSVGEVLLPKYCLEYEDIITFGLKKNWIFRSIDYKGIHL